MKKIVLLLATVLLCSVDANAFDVKILSNNKEAHSKELSRRDFSNLQRWMRYQTLGEEEIKGKALNALATTMDEEEKIDTSCELGIIDRFSSKAKDMDLIREDSEVLNVLTFMRSHDMIDDILYRIMKDAAVVSLEMKASLNNRVSYPSPRRYVRPNDIKLDEFYAPFKTWPDDRTNCTLDTYYRMTNKLSWKNGKDRDSQIEMLNYKAYRSGVIGQETYNKLEVLRQQEVLDWPVYFKRYADIVYNAKDKLTQKPESGSDSQFSETYVSRRDKITRRDRLYMNYDSTQVIMLAQLIEKTAKRMDAREVTLNFKYTDDPNGETEVYIFSPMEQYRAAIKLLKKEMAEMMRSDAFKNSGLQYEDLIAAAYETGLIKSGELDYILKFEDFWNPKTPRWKTYAGFAFSVAGTATFYLPPPWNVIGAIGLVLSQSKLLKDDKLPDSDDNWNVII